jgi:hypothetical protein
MTKQPKKQYKLCIVKCYFILAVIISYKLPRRFQENIKTLHMGNIFYFDKNVLPVFNDLWLCIADSKFLDKRSF